MTDIAVLGLQQKKELQFRNKGIDTLEKLAEYYPRKYNDYRNPIDISKIKNYVGLEVSVVGTISEVRKNDAKRFVSAKISDESGRLINILWFNQMFMASQLMTGAKYVVCGKVAYNEKYNSYSINSPNFISRNTDDFYRIVPVYKKINGMANEYLMSSIKMAIDTLKSFGIEDYIDDDMRARLGCISKENLYDCLHNPKNEIDLDAIELRHKVDMLFPFAMKMGEKKYNSVTDSNKVISDLVPVMDFISALPFKLTQDQSKAIDYVLNRAKSGRRVDSLLQGDVGCGKTIVAISLAIAMASNGYQSAIMAPTSVLAEQHYNDFKHYLDGSDIKVGFLSGNMRAKERRKLLLDIYNGDIDIIVGTHAILTKDVVFSNLGLTVVDEEHRFGVGQRSILKSKADDGVHNISMSATPIPRSLAMTLYGEGVSLLNIHTMPEGRKPVKTIVFSDEKKVYDAMLRQIREGHQCYVICPLVEDSDSELLAGVDSVDATFKKISDYFINVPEVKIDFINGKMKSTDVRRHIDEFSSGKSNILISTTIVEVGVNVPNATVITIKNAERFGLAQLHQLRGRVGRSSLQSYCVLLSDNKDNIRLRKMAETNDGFEISKADLEIRGTGNLIGSEQSGFENLVELMISNPELYRKINAEVELLYCWKNKFDKLSLIL